MNVTSRTWSPLWCSHVVGEAEWEDLDEERPYIRVRMRCLVCQSTWRTSCFSGKWDRKVAWFALIHKVCWERPLPGASF